MANSYIILPTLDVIQITDENSPGIYLQEDDIPEDILSIQRAFQYTFLFSDLKVTDGVIHYNGSTYKDVHILTRQINSEYEKYIYPYYGSRYPEFQNLPSIMDYAKLNTDNTQYKMFCIPENMIKCNKLKNRIGTVNNITYRKIRDNEEKYNGIGSSIFMSRAAIKLAYIDKAMNFTLVSESEPSYHLDLCGGPGGFSEYVMYRKKFLNKTIGFTLKEVFNDYKICNFNDESPIQFFEPFYGVTGTGDIYDMDNIMSIANKCDLETNKVGVDLVTADGGFSVEGDENEQEYKSRKICLCQFLTALLCLKEGGTFVCKTFNLFLRFSVDIFILTASGFNDIAIYKPPTSRLVNSERYAIFTGRNNNMDMCNYMMDIISKIDDMTIVSCLTDEGLDSRYMICNYITRTNNVYLYNQIEAISNILRKIHSHTKYDKVQKKYIDRFLVSLNLPTEKRNINSENCVRRFMQRHKLSTEMFDEIYTHIADPNALDTLYLCLHNRTYLYTGKYVVKCDYILPIPNNSMMVLRYISGKVMKMIRILILCDKSQFTTEDIMEMSKRINKFQMSVEYF